MTWLIYALLAAVIFGLRGILYQWSSKHGFDRNLMLFGVFVSGAGLSFFGAIIWQHPWTPSVLIGLVMGFLSFAGNAAMFKGFSEGKASIIAILTGLTPLLVVVFAFIIFRETLTVMQLVAFGIILIGIILIRYSNDLSLKNLQGAQWGLLAMLFFSLNDTTSKLSTLLDAAIFPTIFCLYSSGATLFGISWLLDQNNKKRNTLLHLSRTAEKKRQIKPASITLLWGMVVGLTNFFGMVLILNAFKHGLAGLVSAVVSLNVLLILLYTRIFLREKFTPLELTGMAAAIIGIVILRLFD